MGVRVRTTLILDLTRSGCLSQGTGKGPWRESVRKGGNSIHPSIHPPRDMSLAGGRGVGKRALERRGGSGRRGGCQTTERAWGW